MRQPSPIRSVRRATLAVMGVAAVAVFVFTLRSGHAASPLGEVAGQEGAVRIEVTLDEYSFSPDPLRIPAGRPVTLVIRNVGRFQHEFMAGRHAAGDDFEHDLFADLHVNIEKVEAADADHAEHEHAETADADHAEHEHAETADADHAEHEQAQAEHAHAAAEHEPAAAGGHAHGEGHEHGTMVENQPGETFLMSFTLPESRRGEWSTACFLPGHYDAGMHGTLVVE